MSNQIHKRSVAATASAPTDSDRVPPGRKASSTSRGSTTSSRASGPTRRRRRKGTAYPRPVPLVELVGLLGMGLVLIACGCYIVVKALAAHGLNLTISLGPERKRKDHMKNLPWNENYSHKDAHPKVGDRSDHYARLRQEIDPMFPEDSSRSLKRVQELAEYTFSTMPMDIHHSDQIPYDIYNCPDQPPPGYPFAWPMPDVLKNWPPDDYLNIPPQIYQGLCVFDYNKDYETAMAYRNAELPFVVVNDPEVARTVERWNHPGYPERLMDREMHRTEQSVNNHFMYAMPPGRGARLRKLRGNLPENWTQPTKLVKMSYKDWVRHANVTDDQLGPDKEHWYFRLIGCGLPNNDGSCDHGYATSEYLFDEMPYFQPKENLYLREPKEQNGIHCRFGMKGVIAENHFDGSRNSIVVLGGSRRYILTHPDECKKLALYPKGHPSARHSEVDWSEPDWEKFPEFATAKTNEVVLQPGEVLYLPTHYFHYIVSLEMNWQCNTRSGIGQEYMPAIKDCGF